MNQIDIRNLESYYANHLSDRGRAFQILLHAHDYIWHDRRIPLAERSLACDLLWSLIILTH